MSTELPDLGSSEAGPEDLLSKKLFEVGVSKLELQIHELQSNLVMAQAQLEQAKLMDDVAEQEKVRQSVKDHESMLHKAKQQVTNLYTSLVPTLDRSLLGILRRDIIENKALDDSQKKSILEVISANR